MANRKQQKGPCYQCGREMAKGYMGRHLLAEHYDENGEQKCYLLKIEDEYSNYWLFVDIPVSSLSTLDSFLRSVWLECCGHMSAFTYVRSCQRLMAEATSLQLSGSTDEGRAFSYLCYKQAC